mgnify:CR=1 FL=1
MPMAMAHNEQDAEKRPFGHSEGAKRPKNLAFLFRFFTP